jgi:hypothetical protein
VLPEVISAAVSVVLASGLVEQRAINSCGHGDLQPCPGRFQLPGQSAGQSQAQVSFSFAYRNGIKAE